jgi:hypothetical protein
VSGDEPTTEELKAVQLDRLRDEREAAQDATESAEQRTHGRRADKAAYLAEKLEEQQEADDA